MNKEGTIPVGTTREQWDRYYEDVKRHEEHYRSIEPKPENFKTDKEFESAMSSWHMGWSCDMPNRPGYYRANND